MGVYINTFRTEYKTARLNGSPVAIYASRYLCRLNDADDHWGERSRRAALMQASMERASTLFAQHKPAFIASVFENDWKGATVYANPTGAIWYDCDAFPGVMVGWLDKAAGRASWHIIAERQVSHNVSIAGHTFTRHNRQRVVNGDVQEVLLYWTDAKGQTFTAKQIEDWRGPAEAEWLAALAKQKAEQDERDRAAAKLRADKQAAKDAEIA